MSLNYNFVDTLKLLLESFNYDIFIAIIISSIIFTILLIINREKKLKYIISIINIILIIIISILYLKNILTLKFTNPINNIYFYFFNTIIYLIILIIKKNYKIIDLIFYGLSMINILFSIFMTYYLNNIDLIVIGNIFPMIKFGNIIYIVYYILMIFRYIVKSK